MTRLLLVLLALAAVSALAWGIALRLAEGSEEAGGAGGRGPVPVEVGPVETGAITARRTFSGELEATAEFVVAPKVGGRLARLHQDLGDEIERGAVVARLDDDEFVQVVNQAEAELEVARTGREEARAAHEIAKRTLERARALHEDGITSESQLDAALAGELASRARVEVTRAEVTRAEAALEAARIRLGYARVTADWSGGDDRRAVARRYVDEGDTVSASSPLLAIVELDPIVAVVHVPERDYANLAPDLEASLTTDAHPGRTFAGRVTRVAPVFRRSTRQARVELRVDNTEEALRPGMFVRVTIALERIEGAAIVPFEALTTRDGRTGLFLVDEQGESVSWRPVEPGVREGELVEVRGEDVVGRVVTLGQELCDDGAAVTLAGTWSPGSAVGAPEAPPGTR